MNSDLGHAWEEETARFDRKLNSLVPLIDELVNNVQRLNVEFEKVKTDLENLTRKSEEQHKRQKQMSVTLVKLDTDIAGLELSKQTFPNVEMQLPTIVQTPNLIQQISLDCTEPACQFAWKILLNWATVLRSRMRESQENLAFFERWLRG